MLVVLVMIMCKDNTCQFNKKYYEVLVKDEWLETRFLQNRWSVSFTIMGKRKKKQDMNRLTLLMPGIYIEMLAQ